MPLESLTAGDWMRSLAWAAVAFAAPVAARRRWRRARGCRASHRCSAVRGERPRDAARACARRDSDRAGGACRAGGARPGLRSAATAIFRSRRSPARRSRCLLLAAPGNGGSDMRARRPKRRWRSTLGRSRRSTSRCNESFANWQSLWFCAGAARASRSLCCRRGPRQAEDAASAAARPARLALCSTRPKAAAASATVTSTIDGRTRLSSAAASATQPNTE